MSGSDSDAVGAYTQVVLDEMPEHDHVETWITLPPSQRPKSWHNIEDPVVKLRLNLYGHPLAGLFWERFCDRMVRSEGFERVPGWECLYVNKSKKVILVDICRRFQNGWSGIQPPNNVATHSRQT